MENVWDKALAFLRQEINEQIFSVWFSPIKLASLDQDSVVLAVPNKFFESWIREKYLHSIKGCLAQVCGKPMEVFFKSMDLPLAEVPSSDFSKDKIGSSSSVQLLKSAVSPAKQLAEPRVQEIGLNPKYTFDTFVVGPSNRFAHAASLAVSENLAKSYNPLFIHGGVGLGKTHLLQAMGNFVRAHSPHARIMYISSETFMNQLIDAIRTKTTLKFRNMYRHADILLIDDVQFIAGKDSTQEEFFHTFNALYDAHKQIVLCSDRSPKDIPKMEERLVSRFAWGLIADIQPPDFETRIAILQKKSENESVPVPKEVLYFLAEKIKTNIRELEGALIRVVAYSKLMGTELSVEFSKETLKGMIEEEKKINVPRIQEVAGSYFTLSLTELKSKKRTQNIAYPRQVAMYLCRILTDHSLPEIGEYFGGRDHTTVLHACEKIGKDIEKNEKTKMLIEKLTRMVKTGQ